MARGEVNAVVVGSDRCAQNGDIINKVGTYPLALMAKEFGVPFFALVQDPGNLASGADVHIEERPASELLSFQGQPLVRDGAERLAGRYPAFDVTPSSLITYLVGFDELFTPESFRQKFLKSSSAPAKHEEESREKYLLVFGVPKYFDFLARELKDQRARGILVAEMRPKLWGAQVVAPPLLQRDVPTTLISDNMMGTLFAQRRIQRLYLFFKELSKKGPVGICGSLLAWLLARAHGVPVELIESSGPEEHATDADVSTFLGRKVIPAGVSLHRIEKEIIPWALLRGDKGARP